MGLKSKKGKGSKPKKEKKKSDGSHIAEGIMPSASLTATPTTPLAPVMPDTEGPPGTSTLLSSSLLGRMFATPTHEDDPSETDTSLYDYENARNTIPYSTVGELGRSIPSPPTGFGDLDSDTEPFSGTASREDFGHRPLTPRNRSSRSVEVIPDVDPMYSLPYEPRPSTSRKNSARDRSYASDDSFHGGRNSGDFGASGSLRASRESRQTDPHSAGDRAGMSDLREDTKKRVALAEEEPIYSMPKKKDRTKKKSREKGNQLFPSDVSGSEKHERIYAMEKPVSKEENPKLDGSLGSAPAKDFTLSMTSSLRLQGLKDQNSQLLQKQVELEHQLHEQQKAQSELMARLKAQGFLRSSTNEESIQEMGSLIQETHSITERTMRKHEEVLQSLRVRSDVLEQEKQELLELNEQLQGELLSYKRMASYRDDDADESGGGTRSLLKKQLMDYKDENDTLKSSVQRLNSELARYQSMFRPLSAVELDELPGLPSRGPKPSWLVNTKYLAPLFVAYDDRLREKDSLLQQSQEDLEHFRQQIDSVIKENQRLHIRLEQTDVSGPLGMTEWRSLQEQCKLVLEENQLLMEEIDIKESKARDMHKAHVHEVSILSKRLVAAEAERSELEQEVRDLQEKMSTLKKSHDKLLIDNKARPELEEHLHTVSDLKKLFEDEKNKHLVEVENLTTKLQSLTAEKKGLSIDMEDLQLENKRLENELRSWHKSQRRLEKKIVLLKLALETTESKEMTAEKYLNSVVRMAEKTAEENNSLTQAVSDQVHQRKATIAKLLAKDASMERMEEKLKACRQKATEKLEKAALRMKEQEGDFSHQKEEYERELKHLRLMVKEKQEMLEMLTGEKKAVEDDLETMWQVASHDNQQMKATVRKTLRKLKQHDIITELLDSDDEGKGDKD